MRLIVAVLLSGTVLTASQVLDAEAQVGKPCNFHHTALGNKRTITCFAHKMNINAYKARKIANRESRFDEWAWNHYSDCRGLFQHMFRYWDDRVTLAKRALNRYNVTDRRWSSPRAQAVVTFVYVHHYGWSAWGG